MICIKFLLLVALTITFVQSRSVSDESPVEQEEAISNRSVPSKEKDEVVIDEREKDDEMINEEVKDEESVDDEEKEDAVTEENEEDVEPPLIEDKDKEVEETEAIGEENQDEQEDIDEDEKDEESIDDKKEAVNPPPIEKGDKDIIDQEEKGEKKEEAVNPPLLKSLIASDAINDFTLDMLKMALSDKKGENVIMSPYSIHAALRMLAAGSKTVSQKELETALRIKTSNLDFFGDLDDAMEPEADEIRFDVANKVFVDKRVKLLDSYEDILMNTMDAEVGVEDFAGKPEKSREKVNKWVEENTEDMIKDLFPSGSLDSTTELVIANAVFYKALWKEPFDEEDTKVVDFQLENGTKVPCDMMFKESKFPQIWDRTLKMQVVRIPYSGDEYDFVAAIPDSWPTPVPLSEKEADISSETVKGWLNRLQKRGNRSVRKIMVYLPKFKAELEMDLEESLKRMGISSIFGGQADLSGITGSKNLYVGSARHKAFIEVNEAGTKAAAATGFGIMRMSMPVQVRLERPFLYFVVHRETNTIVFSGRMSNPSA